MVIAASVLSLTSGRDRDAWHDRQAKQTADPSTPPSTRFACSGSGRDDNYVSMSSSTGRLGGCELESDSDVGGGGTVCWQGYVKGRGVLSEFQVLIVAEQRCGGDLCGGLRAAGAEGGNDCGAFGPALNEDVDGGTLGGEANVGGGEVWLFAFVETAASDDFGGGAFAEDLPRTGGVDAFAVDGHPCGDAGEDLALSEVKFAGVG